MTSLAVRLIIAVGGVAALVAGLFALTSGDPGGVVWIVLGLGAVLAVLFERARYRSEAAAPGPPFQPTDEAFVDPTTRRRTRVYVNPNTGERRYHVES